MIQMFIFCVNDFNNCQPLGINQNHGPKLRPCEKFPNDFCTSESLKKSILVNLKNKMVLKSLENFYIVSTLVQSNHYSINFQMSAIKFIPLSMPLNTESLLELWGLNSKELNGMKPNDENLPGCVLCTWPLKFWQVPMKLKSELLLWAHFAPMDQNRGANPRPLYSGITQPMPP